MSCIISDVTCNVDATGAIVPTPGRSVIIVPTILPVFISLTGEFREITYPTLAVVSAPTTGAWSAVLPWPSESDPSTVRWQITLPDGNIFVGAIPEGATGPLTIHDLKNSYGWALQASPTGVAPLSIQGPPGPGLVPTVTKTAAYTAAVGQLVRCDPTAAPFAVTLPAASAKAGLVVVKHQSASANTVTVTPAGADTIDGVAGNSALFSRETLYLCSDGVSDWMVL